MIKHLGLSTLVLLAGMTIATAQQQAPADSRNDQAKPAQNGAEEPSSRVPAPADTNVFVNGRLAVPGAPQDGQTVPSTVSERNARLDEMPIMALPLGLTDDQKRLVSESTVSAPISQISAKLADVLPATTPVSKFSADVKRQVPMLGDVDFIRTKDKILLVRAPNMVVTGEVSPN